MDHWTPQEWALFLGAAAAFISAAASTVAAFMASLAKLKGDANGRKIEANTEITQKGADTATENAKTAATAAKLAADTATRAKQVAEHIDRKLNGGIDEAINQAVSPILATVENQARAADDVKARVTRVDDKVDELTEYVHKRHHDILDTLSVLANRVNILIAKQEETKK